MTSRPRWSPAVLFGTGAFTVLFAFAIAAWIVGRNTVPAEPEDVGCNVEQTGELSSAMASVATLHGSLKSAMSTPEYADDPLVKERYGHADKIMGWLWSEFADCAAPLIPAPR